LRVRLACASRAPPTQVNGQPPQQQQQAQQQQQPQQAQQAQAQQQGGHGGAHGPPHGAQAGAYGGPPAGGQQGGVSRGPPGAPQQQQQQARQGYGGAPAVPRYPPPQQQGNGPPHGGHGGGDGGGYQLACVPAGGHGGHGGHAGGPGGRGHGGDAPGSPSGGGALVPLAQVLPELPSSSLFNQMQRTALQVLTADDYQSVQGKKFIKKNGWRRLAFYFNISTEVRSQNETCDQNGNVMRANFVVRASMSNGRFSDAYGSCDRGACPCAAAAMSWS